MIKARFYLFCVGFGILGGILRRLVVADGGSNALEPGRRTWEDNEECLDEDGGEDEDGGSRSLAWTTKHQTESINEKPNTNAANDLVMDFMALFADSYYWDAVSFSNA